MSAKPHDVMDDIVSLCKRRGFVFPSSEIYGGINASWDYGPLGVEMKNRIKAAWWQGMTQLRDDVEGIDAAILMHPRTWEASGHVEHFTDPLVDCTKCRRRFRADETVEGACPHCGAATTEERPFNLMFKTRMGPVEAEGTEVYLRPETCQGIYVNFHNVATSARRRPPFGIAQVGKAFRNEISPGHFIFRSREFEQMEMQYFVPPSEADRWFEHWRQARYEWLLALGIREENLRIREQTKEERAHYARAACDIEYKFPFGWQEFEGIHNRGDWDLTRHAEFASKDLRWFDDQTKERFVPYVVETSIGVERLMLVLLCDAFDVDDDGKRTVLRLSPKIAPYQVAIFPLVKRDGLPERAREIEARLRPHFKVFYDEKGAVGRRYRRQDEAGTPFCLTVDSETIENDTVTLRDRDSMQQDKVPVPELVDNIRKRIDVPPPGLGATHASPVRGAAASLDTPKNRIII